MYIMITYSTLQCSEVSFEAMTVDETTCFTAGARAARFTIAKPAARTAVAWKSPSMTRTPAGIAPMTELPKSRIRKENQSVALEDNIRAFWREEPRVSHVMMIRTLRRNQVW